MRLFQRQCAEDTYAYDEFILLDTELTWRKGDLFQRRSGQCQPAQTGLAVSPSRAFALGLFIPLFARLTPLAPLMYHPSRAFTKEEPA